MTSHQRSPLWPFLLVLAGLFMLSLAVPRGWQDSSEDGRRTLTRHAQNRYRNADGAVAVLRPEEESGVAPVASVPAANGGWSNYPWAGTSAENPTNTADSVVTATGSQATSFIGPLAETVARKIADLRHFDPLHYLHTESNSTPPGGAASDWQTSNPSAATVYGTIGKETLGVTSQQNADAVTPTGWPVPKSLIAQLQRLAQNESCSAWAAQVEQQCIALCQTSPGDPHQAVEIVKQLQVLSKQAESLDGTLKSASAATEFRRVRYALIRRLALWNAAFPAAGQSAVYADVPSAEVQRQRLSDALTAADEWICSIPYADAWRSYLLIDDISKLTDEKQSLSSEQTQQIARRALARLLPEQMTATQRQVLQDRKLVALAEQLRTWTGQAVDAQDVLTNVEQYETSNLLSDAHRVAVALRQLNWSAAEQDHQLAQQLDEHYRNANLRVVLTAELLNRLAPDQPTAKGVVNDTILGASVNGTSTTNSQLQVKLIPDPQRLHLWIEAQGTVDSITSSTSGPATFDNSGRSDFVVHKAVVLDRQGLWIANAAAEANSNTQLTGFRTDYDNMPIIGSFVRRSAISQRNSLLSAAEQETDEKVAAQASQQVNAEVKQHFTEAERAVQKGIIDPLAKLNLTAEPISLETTAQRLTTRLRIAGQNQLGGHTARPQAFSDSYASAQVHESALNNILDQLQLAGHTFTLPELYQQVAEKLSWNKTTPPADLPADVRITFPVQDPVRVSCQDGVVQLTLAVDELQQKNRQWKNFTVTVNFEPQIEDLHVRLVRQGTIELGGDEHKGESALALRGAFSKLFPRERTVELVPEWIADSPRLAGLCITQCVVEDGWLGLAIGPEREESQQSVMQEPATAKR